MSGNQEEIENTLKSVKDLINSSRKISDSDNEILELTEDDLFDEQDENSQDVDDYKKNKIKKPVINQFLTSVDDTVNNSLEKAIAESIKPFLKEWLEQTITEIIKKELKK